MNPIRALRRLACIMAGLAVAIAAPVPAALASASRGRTWLLAWADPPLPVRPSPADSPPLNLPGVPGAWNKHPPLPAHTITSGSLPGWQVTLIAAAALLAVGLAATGYRILAARRKTASAA